MAIWNDPQPGVGIGAAQRVNPGFAGQGAVDAGQRSFMLRIYNYMASGVLLSGLVAIVFAQWLMSDQAHVQAVFGSPLRWVIALAPLGFVMAMSFGLNRMQTSTVQILFWVFCVAMGLSLSSIFLVYTGPSIAATFFASAAAFAGLSLVGYTTKRNLSAMGTFMAMGVWGLIAAMLVPFGADGFADIADRRGDLCRPDRLGYPAFEGDVLAGRRRRLCREGRDHGGDDPLSRFHQHVHVPAAFHGRSPLTAS